MEITKKKVVKSVYYYKDIQDIFEYGEATFGEKAALSFFDELLMVTHNLETLHLLHSECRHLEDQNQKIPKYHFWFLPHHLQNYPNRIEVLKPFTAVVLQNPSKDQEASKSINFFGNISN